MKASLSVISLINYAFSVVSKKSCPNLRSFRFSPILCSRSFMVLRFTFRSVILFQLIFVTGIRLLSRFFFFFALNVLLFQHHLLKIIYLLHSIAFAPLFKDQLTIWVYIWALQSIPLICLSILCPIPHHLDYYSFKVSL